MFATPTELTLGLGLISVGRLWGAHKNRIPSEDEVELLLSTAVRSGIRVFDTAPAYGLSEQRLGRFLNSLGEVGLNELFVATKCGEHWDAASSSTFVDHSPEALIRSIDSSLSRLRKIDLLQIHKATPEILKSYGVARAIEYARSRGIHQFGASIGDSETAGFLLADSTFSYVQMPLNSQLNSLCKLVPDLISAGKTVVLNRPLGMGHLLYTANGGFRGTDALKEAYEFIFESCPRGIVLSGASTSDHLIENLAAFANARSNWQEQAGNE